MRSASVLAAALFLLSSGFVKADQLVYYSGTVAGTSDEAYYDPVYQYETFREITYTRTATATYDVDTGEFPSFVVQTHEGPFTAFIYGLNADHGCYGFDDCIEVFNVYDPDPNVLTFFGQRAFQLDALPDWHFLDGFSGKLSVVSDNSNAVTPEPGGFVLLGTGLLGVAGVVRRRVA